MTARTPVPQSYGCRSLSAPITIDLMTERKFPDMWVDPEDDPRETGEPPCGEMGVLVDYLDRYRMTLEMKCEGLDAEQMARRSVPPSTLSLLGLVRHLARVEHSWTRRVLEGQMDLPRLYRTEEDRDLDFNGAVADDAVVADAWESWRREVDHARALRQRRRLARRAGARRRRGRRAPRHRRAHDRGVRPPLRPRRPAPRVHRRPHRPVTDGLGG